MTAEGDMKKKKH